MSLLWKLLIGAGVWMGLAIIVAVTHHFRWWSMVIREADEDTEHTMRQRRGSGER